MNHLNGAETVYLGREGEAFGPYTVNDIRQMIREGQILETDLVCFQGESEWRSWQELVTATAPAPAAAEAALHTPVQSPSTRPAVILGAVVGLLAVIVAIIFLAVPKHEPTANPVAEEPPPDFPGALVADWDFSKARTDGDTLLIPGGKEPLREVFGNGDGVEVVDDPSSPDGRAVRFSGAGDHGLESKGLFELKKGDHLRIEIDFNPSSDNDTPRRIFRLGNAFEFRLIPKKQALHFIVWNGKKYFELSIPVNFDTWNQVIAEHRDGVLYASVNGETLTMTLPEGRTLQGWKAKIHAFKEIGGQFFIGSIGRIRWTTESTVWPVTAQPPAAPTPATPSASHGKESAPLLNNVAPTTLAPANLGDPDFHVPEPTIFSQFPPVDTVSPKKVLIVPHNASVVEQIATAKVLREAGHHVDYAPTGHGSANPRHVGNQLIHPKPTEILDNKAVSNPDFASYDLIFAFGGDDDKDVLMAIQRGQRVLLDSDEGPWSFLRRTLASREAEQKYLEQQVANGFLKHSSDNTLWSAAPWRETASPDRRAMAFWSGTSGQRSRTRPSDIVALQNVMTFSLPDQGSTKGYSVSYGVDSGTPRPLSDEGRIAFARRYIFPAILRALNAPQTLSPRDSVDPIEPAPGVPVRACLPRSFPISRPNEEGQVVVWGFSAESPGGASRSGELQSLLNPPEGLRAVQVATAESGPHRDFHCLALKADGTVVAWGADERGQCNVPADLGDVVSVTAGDGVSLAIKSDGTVRFWGGGKLFDSIPKDLRDIVQVAFTNSGTLFLSADGRLRHVCERGDVDTRASSLSDVVAVAGGRFGYALLGDGRLFALEDPSSREGSSLIPTDLPPVVALAALDSNASHMIVIHANGSLRAWGRNDTGQCDFPLDISPVRSVSTSHDHAVAIGLNGRLTIWGWNWYGEQLVPENLRNAKFIQAVAGRGYTLGIIEPNPQDFANAHAAKDYPAAADKRQANPKARRTLCKRVNPQLFRHIPLSLLSCQSPLWNARFDGTTFQIFGPRGNSIPVFRRQNDQRPTHRTPGNS